MAASTPVSLSLASVPAPKKSKLLVVEGDDQTAELVARVLTAENRDVEVVHTNGVGNPSEAIADDWPTLHLLGRRYIDRVLVRTGGNKTRAAEVLGIDRRTLNRMFARERAKKAEAAKVK
jgi:transcriptional regulator with PAS, ATPase and Fis domain